MAEFREKKWYGNPHICARIPKDHWHAVRAASRKSGVLPSDIIRGIIAAWIQDGNGVHSDSVADLALQTPQIKAVRNESGKSERIATLQQIDRTRNNSEKAAFNDL